MSKRYDNPRFVWLTIGGLAVAVVAGGAFPLLREIAGQSRSDRPREPWEDG